jgi:hypothetical protein
MTEHVFIIERPHPGFKPPHAARPQGSAQITSNVLVAALPITVNVTSEPRGEKYGAECECQIVYRLTVASVERLASQFLLRKGLGVKRRPCICACMGTIEDWPTLNRERGLLIDKQIAGTLAGDEIGRLGWLQRYADQHIERFRQTHGLTGIMEAIGTEIPLTSGPYLGLSRKEWPK